MLVLPQVLFAQHYTTPLVDIYNYKGYSGCLRYACVYWLELFLRWAMRPMGLLFYFNRVHYSSYINCSLMCPHAMTRCAVTARGVQCCITSQWRAAPQVDSIYSIIHWKSLCPIEVVHNWREENLIKKIWFFPVVFMVHVAYKGFILHVRELYFVFNVQKFIYFLKIPISAK